MVRLPSVRNRPGKHLPDAIAQGDGVHLSGHHFFSLFKRTPMPQERRAYSKSFKAQVIAECAQPDTSIANVACQWSTLYPGARRA